MPVEDGNGPLTQTLSVSAPTVTSYVDLLADFLPVRRLQSFHANTGKRLVKSPKTYVRNSGIVLALLSIEDLNDFSGHPVVGASWEGFIIGNLLSVAPTRKIAVLIAPLLGPRLTFF
ncbi:DUF4143 domain-containing protein [Mesorhizobium denitrificans]|uniref:DUF4143 domain-containing protein n=1 Tax=Mesorhizobium denitrificans TaxID=2294114 RepID=UPI0013142E6D|nr:DUF4143 domain-containing protein [Mesorhizobium denitrificans]